MHQRRFLRIIALSSDALPKGLTKTSEFGYDNSAPGEKSQLLGQHNGV